MAMIYQGKEVVAASYSFLPRSKFSYVTMNSVNVLTPNTVPAWIIGLHKRLTHIKCSGLKRLDATKELRLTKEQRTILNSINKIPCVECDNAGLHAAPVKAQSTHPLEKTRGVAYVDLHGPLIMSRGGAIWILALRESWSGVLVVTFPKNKGESARMALKEAILIMVRVYEVKLQTLRSDRGTEFISYEMSQWLISLGIRPSPTDPESSKRNGMVEVVWRIVVPRAKTMLATANMQKHYWADAVSYAAKVLNMVPSRTRDMKSPIQLLTGKKPDLKRIYPWGCLVLVKLLRGRGRKKR